MFRVVIWMVGEWLEVKYRDEHCADEKGEECYEEEDAVVDKDPKLVWK